MTRQAALLAVAKVVGFALSFPLPLVLVRTLDQPEFGLYKQVFQILATALALLSLQVSLSAYYYMPRFPDKKSQVALNVLIFHGTVGTAAAIFFIIYPRWVSLIFHSDDLVPHIPLLGVAILLWLVALLLEVVTVADGDIRSATIFTVVSQLSKSVLLMAGALYFNSVHALVWAAVLQGALQCAILCIYLHRRFGKFWQSFDWELFKAQLANAVPFGLGALVYATQADLHNYFVSHYYSPADFAIYAVGCFQLPLLGLLLEAVISVLLPEVARRQAEGDYEAIITLWASAIRKLAFFCLPVYLLLFVLRREFITALFTKDYEAAVPIFAINLLNILLIISVPTSILRAFAELKFYRLKLSLAMLPVTFAVLYVSIKHGGLVGAITACVLLQTLDLGVILVKIARKLEVTAKDLGLLGPILKTIVAAVGAAAATFIVKLLIGDDHALITLIVCSAVFGVVFLALAFVTGAMTDDEKALLRTGLLRFQRVGAGRVGYSTTEL